MIKIQCQEKIFLILEENLRKSEYFNSKLSGRWSVDDIIIVDEDPRIFRHFLNILRRDTYRIPDKYVDNVLDMLLFYGVKYTKINEETMWTIKIKVIDKQYETFTFTGKLLDIGFYCDDIRQLCVSFNEKDVFNDIIFSATTIHNVLPKYADGYHHLNKDIFGYLYELEGTFRIIIKYVDYEKNDKHYKCYIYYMEKFK